MKDDRDDHDPIDDILREIERVMNEMMGDDVHIDRGGSAGFGSDLHLDVHETDGEIRVVADLPGVEKDAIDLKCDGEVLTVSAASDRRDYEERVRLPTRVDEHSAAATYNNGVLEVTFERADDSADIDL
ncbi:Hsp20/alpha crystallin family protein [Halorientalis salina]|jgi:HSP20 family protein|uniref:Hsp20/alpha crystallin family protein n=1 Tax=Halorientalis salina TaxID=2932266 RepID=UPI0010ACE1DD|nr:Hsp20/alpha crystallin family protein [Halorientalis salina]